MVGLLDIAPVSKAVDIDGIGKVDVPGVSAEGIAHLLELFPQFTEIEGLIAKKGGGDLAAVLVSLGPKVLHNILAAGCGYPGNPEAVERVGKLDLTAQADLLDAILAKTLSKGLDHFLGRVRSIRATLTPPATLADKVQEAVLKKKPSSSASNSSSPRETTQPAMSGA